jgi:hypothetical protein
MDDKQLGRLTDRYPGLWSFGQEQASIFFGRDREKRELFHRVRSAQVTVIFAKSGIGKSSLLNAGVVPMLIEANYLPINVSFTKTAGETQSLLPIAIFKNALKAYSNQRESPFGHEGDSLWDYFKSCKFPLDTIPVLIFDQFEELFTYPAEEVDFFLSELSELTHELPPSRMVAFLLNIKKEERTLQQKMWIAQEPVKFIFGIRSDKLSDLQKADERIPGLFANRYELLPMNQENARLAIINPARDSTEGRYTSKPFTFEKTAIDRITENLKSDNGHEIEPSQLQIVCRHIEEKVKASYGDKDKLEIREITVKVFDADTETDDVLHNHYEQQLGQLGNAEEQLLCRNLLEKELLEQSGNGFIRIRLSEGRVKDSLNRDNELLLRLLKARLIKPEMDESGQAVYYQISHDSLKDPILRSRSESTERENEQARRYATLEEAKKLINEHYELLKIGDTEGSIGLLGKAELLFEEASDTQGTFETGILIVKVMESRRDFLNAQAKLSGLLSFVGENEHRRSGMLNECFGVISSKDGQESLAFEYFKKALAGYETMFAYDQMARMSEHLGGIREDMFYNSQRDGDSKDIVQMTLVESEEFYNSASRSYLLINDNFGYERVKRSLRRLQENRAEVETPGFTYKAWGFFTELFTGKVHPLKGKGTIRIGRNVPNLKNEIGFWPKNNYMSRRHVSITPDLIIEDTQSLNGTTINNIPLYYGTPRKLGDGDIVVLGNVMPMLFTLNEPNIEEPPAGCWAIFIDGEARKYHYLTTKYNLYAVSVGMDESEQTFKLLFQAGDRDDSVMRFRLSRYVEYLGEERLFITKDSGMLQWKLRSSAKDSNRDYYDFKIPLGAWRKAIVSPVKLRLANYANNHKRELTTANDPTFQLVVHEDFDT